ncbi:fumarylacetoacetate hydrolase family protein [Alkalihalobacterium elongatum]|uniref:fumarylacetoacetate hydrolase family protein n=1 Tax=Alkalihalobacterium elongatum TaxID=2675466 RepID=UPI001C1F6361|nr:fumarylacetoacetate hydrolase family protein [Alkalihalobacterium elongatum]
MKIISYLKENRMSVGVIQDKSVIDISNVFPNVLSIIKAGREGIEEINKFLSSKPEQMVLKNEDLLPPITKLERNIICVGWNYLEHFNERAQQDIELPNKPTIFTKATTTVAGPYEDIPYPKKFTNKLDYEAELAVVIGREGKQISEENASEYIFGYMCANDISARDVQQLHGGQWFMGKSMDKSCPLGPWLVTKDEIKDAQRLDIHCKVNGQIVQSSNTSLMIFPINKIIAEISKAMTIMPGDIILTGTPSGIGSKREPPILLKEGDIIEVSISEIGRINNKIITEKIR